MFNTSHYFPKISIFSLLLALLVEGHFAFAYRPPDTPKPFILFSRELSAEGYPMRMVDLGLAHLKFVRFVPEEKLNQATARYYPTLNLMVLSQGDLQFESGLLRAVSELSAGDLGVLYHEIWHSFFSGKGRKNGFVMKEVNHLYWEYDQNVRETIQEEGYGLFIQKVINAYVLLSRNLRKASPDVRVLLKARPELVKEYENVFRESCPGYYVDHDKGIIWSRVSIEERDKDFILHNLLDGKITGKFSLDFEKF